MDQVIKRAKAIQGRVRVPADKSISHRALILGALARGRTTVENLSPGRDVASTVRCLQDLGVPIDAGDDKTIVYGQGLYSLTPPNGPLDVGNSGTTLRLLAGVLAAQGFPSTLTGDGSLQRRPMGRIIRPLRRMGAEITAREDSFAPLTIRGGDLGGIRYEMEIGSAQVKSCIFLAGLHAAGETVVVEPTPSRDHTERMLKYLGAAIEVREREIEVSMGELEGRRIQVPGDISSGAFLIAAAALLPGSELLIEDVGINPTRIGFIDVLQEMGAEISVINRRESANEPRADLLIRAAELRGIEVGGSLIPRLIDELPLLAVVATQAEGRTVIREAAELRVKETDRIRATVASLERLGAEIEELPDGMVIQGPAQLKGAIVDSEGDHRIVMANAVAALLARGQTTVRGAEWADVSFPGFFETLEAISIA